jgi:hypothetical protein
MKKGKYVLSEQPETLRILRLAFTDADEWTIDSN